MKKKKDRELETEEPKTEELELEEVLEDVVLVKVKEELSETKDSWLRAVAELDNARKKWAKERQDLFSYAQIDLIRGIIPVLDHFEHAMQLLPDVKDEFEQGIEMIYKEMNNTLEKYGLVKINDLKDKDFDPFEQEAASHEEDEDVAEDKVIEVLRSGYKFKDVLIRPAMVKVSKGKFEQDKTGGEGNG
ncbi:MAG: nucleotide exchange factor GrpE [Candidatus Kaelpia aquatica]|nr:nucleotide exchange factor GrpE [Candidatus Kaelpia aquatica]